MDKTDGNVAWALDKLALFSGYRGFPTNPEMLKLHAKAFLNVVRNGKIWELLREDSARSPYWRHPDYGPVYFEAQIEEDAEKYGFDETTNDVDYLIEKLIAEGTQYPLPPDLRRRYQLIAGLRPADGKYLDEE